MPRLEFAQEFVNGFAEVTSPRVETGILACLDSLEVFGGLGSPNVPDSIKSRFGDVVRYMAVDPFDIIYSFYPELDLVRVEALLHQRTVE